jgi:hypothetical protein
MCRITLGAPLAALLATAVPTGAPAATRTSRPPHPGVSVARVPAHATHRGLAGRVRLDGRRYTFRARRAHGPAGLYHAGARTPDGGVEAGWIVLADGTQRGAVNRFISSNLELAVPKPAPPLDPGHPTVTISDGSSNTIPPTARRVSQPGLIDVSE